jgi:hypothetical protein
MHRHKQRGAALVVGMVMLTILTLLAITAMSTSSTELVMAGNEQFRERAFQVAEVGVEQAMRDVQTGTAGTDRSKPYKQDKVASTALPDDNYSIVVQYMGEDSDVPGYSANKFVGLHYRIDSNGLSVRNAQSNVRQGTYVLSGPSGSGPSGGAVPYLAGADAP